MITTDFLTLFHTLVRAEALRLLESAQATGGENDAVLVDLGADGWYVSTRRELLGRLRLQDAPADATLRTLLHDSGRPFAPVATSPIGAPPGSVILDAEGGVAGIMMIPRVPAPVAPTQISPRLTDLAHPTASLAPLVAPVAEPAKPAPPVPPRPTPTTRAVGGGVRFIVEPEPGQWRGSIGGRNVGVPSLVVHSGPSVISEEADRIELAGLKGLVELANQPEAPSDLFAVRGDATDAFMAPPPAPTAPTPARWLNAQAPQRVRTGEEFGLALQVALEAATQAGHAAANIRGFSGTLTLDVHAPGFACEPASLKLAVPASGESQSVRFALRALRPGRQSVAVTAWNGSAQVAGLTLEVAVDAEPAADNAAPAQTGLEMREPEDGEYTLDVAFDDTTRRYRFQLRNADEVWPPMFSEPLLGGRQDNYARLLGQLNAQARNLYRLQPADQAIWLRGLGNLLFEQLVPDALKDALLKHRERIRTMNILCDADATPWELLFLADPETGDGAFLAESMVVARWRYGALPARRLRHARPVYVLPDGAPPAAQSELARLRTLLGEGQLVDQLGALNTCLDAADFDLLHFAAHNVLEPAAAGGAYVPFGPQRWDTTFLGAIPRNRFRRNAPLVFMNACTSAGTTPLYTELSSWADRFLACGSGAFVGALWEVRDASAREFSAAVYASLKEGATLGAAVRAGRTELRKNKGDPSALAYTLYGHPLATLQ